MRIELIYLIAFVPLRTRLIGQSRLPDIFYTGFVVSFYMRTYRYLLDRINIV